MRDRRRHGSATGSRGARWLPNFEREKHTSLHHEEEKQQLEAEKAVLMPEEEHEVATGAADD